MESFCFCFDLKVHKKDSTIILFHIFIRAVNAEYSSCVWRERRGERRDWSQLAYLHGEDTSSRVSFVENGVECERLAKWAPHLAPRALFKHRLVPGVETEPKHLHSAGP